MSLNKAIEHKKEHRKEYKGAKAVDRTCRNHGDCLWCRNNRLYQYKKNKKAAKQALKDIKEEF